MPNRIIVITIVYYIIIIQFKPLVFRLYAHQISRAYLKVKSQIWWRHVGFFISFHLYVIFTLFNLKPIFSGTFGIDILKTQRMFEECSELSPDGVKGTDLSEVLGILFAILKSIKRTHEISLIICSTINVICLINFYFGFLNEIFRKNANY